MRASQENSVSIGKAVPPTYIPPPTPKVFSRTCQAPRGEIARTKTGPPHYWTALHIRGFLKEFLREVEAEHVPAAHWLGAVNQVLKLTTTRRSQRIAEHHQIHWETILPLSAIERCPHPKVRRFQEQQLGKAYQKSQVPSSRSERG